jgi:hypothetical protein
MTYQQLLNELSTLNAEQLAQDVTIYVENNDEFYPVQHLGVNAYSDVLDINHPFLEV